VASLLISRFWPSSGSLPLEVSQLNWVSAALGLTIVGVDVGYSAALPEWVEERVLGFVFCNSRVALLLIPIGVALFQERLIPANTAQASRASPAAATIPPLEPTEDPL
jgi:hypothetical protein